jgi:hypothetical protein
MFRTSQGPSSGSHELRLTEVTSFCSVMNINFKYKIVKPTEQLNTGINYVRCFNYNLAEGDEELPVCC